MQPWIDKAEENEWMDARSQSLKKTAWNLLPQLATPITPWIFHVQFYQITDQLHSQLNFTVGTEAEKNSLHPKN